MRVWKCHRDREACLWLPFRSVDYINTIDSLLRQDSADGVGSFYGGDGLFEFVGYS